MPNPWIVSHLPGRLRVRDSALRQASRNELLQATLRGWDGVLSVTGNPATGGVLIHYDPARLPSAEIETRVGATLRPPVSGGVNERAEDAKPLPAPTVWRMNRAAKIGMLGSLSGTLLALAVGKRLHAAFGVAHLAFLAVHLTTHRKKLLR
ncbi:hypothetical protein [Azospirillum doebereinerae]